MIVNEDNVRAALATRLTELRDAHGRTQEDIASVVGITAPMLSNYERGTATPRVWILASLAAEYEVTAGYLLGLEDE